MEALGIADEIADVPRESESDPEKYGVWPENIRTLNVFIELQTQWEMVAVDGELIRTRLMYESFETVKRYTSGVRPGEWAKIFTSLRRMESAALVVLRKERTERLAQEEARRAAAGEK